jgi:hypothetical protein
VGAGYGKLTRALLVVTVSSMWPDQQPALLHFIAAPPQLSFNPIVDSMDSTV